MRHIVALKMTEIDFALSQEEDTEIIELVGIVLWNKASEVKEFSELSQPEQTFIYIDIFESELIHGGLFDFFYNTSGAYAHEVLDAFAAIGAIESTEYIHQAIKSIPILPVPKDIFERRSVMNQLPESTTIIWETLETSLLNSEEDIATLIINYVTLHKTFFEY
ncbi:MAG: DUF4375 domain-containing protein [Psychroserpens sp.]|uniref:DMP19 family protein n=1 Tax=Psychroserpens sp. TaxID=2020870 RepID=UPI003CB0F27B